MIKGVCLKLEKDARWSSLCDRHQHTLGNLDCHHANGPLGRVMNEFATGLGVVIVIGFELLIIPHCTIQKLANVLTKSYQINLIPTFGCYIMKWLTHFGFRGLQSTSHQQQIRFKMEGDNFFPWYYSHFDDDALNIQQECQRPPNLDCSEFDGLFTTTPPLQCGLHPNFSTTIADVNPIIESPASDEANSTGHLLDISQLNSLLINPLSVQTCIQDRGTLQIAAEKIGRAHV